MSKITVESARAHIAEALEQYVRCPAETDFENGFMAALYVIGEEALGMEFIKAKQAKSPERRAKLAVVK